MLRISALVGVSFMFAASLAQAQTTTCTTTGTCESGKAFTITIVINAVGRPIATEGINCAGDHWVGTCDNIVGQSGLTGITSIELRRYQSLGAGARVDNCDETLK